MVGSTLFDELLISKKKSGHFEWANSKGKVDALNGMEGVQNSRLFRFKKRNHVMEREVGSNFFFFLKERKGYS